MLHLIFVVLDDYGKKMETVMINNSTNINKIDNIFSSKITEHKKMTTYSD
jgi:hypothetical protein